MAQFTGIKERPVAWLKGNIDRANICEDFDEPTLNAIGQDVLKWYRIDDESRSEWKEQVERGMAIARQEIDKEPGPLGNQSTKSKDPLIAEAAMNFAARAMAEVVRGKDVVKTEVVGNDDQGAKEARGKRVSQMMSYQLLKQQPEWVPDTDQLLTSLPIIGMYYKKTYRDDINGRNASPALSPLTEVIVHNDTKTLKLAPRISYLFERDRNYVIERIRAGKWSDIEAKLLPEEDAPLQAFVEQICWYDLDDDGYKEPYFITVHKESGAVARICVCYEEDGLVYGKSEDDEGGQKVLRITALDYYTEFGFLPQPDGTFHKMGFAQLLGAINEEINTIRSQLVDSGTIANLRPGFIGKGGKIPAGGVRFQLGRLIPVESTGQDLRANIVFPDFAGPSDVLFKLLGLLDDKGHKLASISEGMQGEQAGANVPATTVLALLDQALKVYTSILWRQYRAFEQEYWKLYRLNSLYLTDEEYRNVVDDPQASVAADFNMKDCDIEPVMDPKASSEALRLARLNAMAQSASMPPAVGRIYLKGIGCNQHDIDAIFPPPQMGPDGKPVPPPPDPKMVEVQAKITQMQHQGAQKDRELDLKHAEMEQKDAVAAYTIEKLQAEIANIKANSILALANAEKAEVGTQLAMFQTHMDALQQELNRINADRDHELARVQSQIGTQGGADDGAGNGDDGNTGGQQDDAAGADGQQDDAAGGEGFQGTPAMPGAAIGTGAGEFGPSAGGDDVGKFGGRDSRVGPHSGATQLAGAESRPMM